MKSKTKYIITVIVAFIVAGAATVFILQAVNGQPDTPSSNTDTPPTSQNTEDPEALRAQALEAQQTGDNDKALELLEKEKAIYAQSGDQDKLADVDQLISIIESQPEPTETKPSGAQ